MNIVNYNEKYFNLFLDCFLLFWEEKWVNINKELVISNLTKKLNQDSKNLYLYILDKKVIWFIWGKILISENMFLNNSYKLHISYLFIMKNYTWKWYASDLKKILLENNKWIKKVSLNVNLKNLNAINIYKKWWFKEKFFYMDLNL